MTWLRASPVLSLRRRASTLTFQNPSCITLRSNHPHQQNTRHVCAFYHSKANGPATQPTTELCSLNFRIFFVCFVHVRSSHSLPDKLVFVLVGATTRNHKLMTLLVTTFSLLSLRLCFHLRSIFLLFCQKKEGDMHVATATFVFTSATLRRRVLRLPFFPVS